MMVADTCLDTDFVLCLSISQLYPILVTLSLEGCYNH